MADIKHMNAMGILTVHVDVEQLQMRTRSQALLLDAYAGWL